MLAAVGVPQGAAAEAQEVERVYDFDIHEETLGGALTAIARQTNLVVLYPQELARKTGMKPVVGRFTVREAIRTLFRDTQFSGGLTEHGVIYISISDNKQASNGERDMSDRHVHKSLWASVIAFLSGAGVHAEEAPASAVPLEEVVVTAQKRQERLVDVPASVTALATENLTASGQIRMADYAARIPGLTVSDQSTNAGQNQVAIRGIATGNAGTPTVGIYLDDVPFSASTQLAQGNQIPDVDPADLERIEVLRGPQGTLYGGGSMGGLIKYVTKAPDFQTFSAHGEVQGSTVEHGAEGYAVRAALNAPVNETVAVRASAFSRQDPGFIDNALSGQDGWNRVRQYGGRAAMGVALSDRFVARLTAYGEHSDTRGNRGIDLSATTGEPLNPDLVTRRAPGSEFTKNTDYVYDLRIEGALGWAQLVSATSYGRHELNNSFDYSPVLGPTIDSVYGSEGAGAAVPGNTKTDKFTQEVRLSSSASETWEWLFGAVYTHESSDVLQHLFTFDRATGGLLPVALPDNIGSYATTSTFEEAAAFGDLTYHFTSKFDVTLGSRYSHNDQSAVNTTSGFFGAADIPMSSRGDSTTFLFNPRYRFDDDLIGYLRIASGYRPGGPNAPVGGAPASYDADTTVNYELGFKGNAFDKRLALDIDAFYIKWRKIQLSGLSSISTVYIFNGGEARSQGFETTLTYRPIRQLSLTGNLAYIDAVLDGDLPSASSTFGRDGDRLPDTPKWAGLLSADYHFALSADWTGSFGVDYRYVSDRPGELAATRYTMPAYHTIDLRAGLQRGRYSINLFANNISDERAYLSTFLMSSVRRVTVNTPRTIGLMLSAQL